MVIEIESAELSLFVFSLVIWRGISAQHRQIR